MFRRLLMASKKGCLYLAFGIPLATQMGKRGPFAHLEEDKPSISGQTQSFFVRFAEISQLDDLAKDVIVLFNPDELRDKYVKQVYDLLEAMCKENPNLVVVKLASKENFPFGAIPEDEQQEAFGLMRRKGEKDFEAFDHFSFFMKQKSIVSFFAPIVTLANVGELRELSKFQMVVGTCEADKEKERFLKQLSAKEVYSSANMLFFNFDSCSKLNGASNDLFLIKKHSKFNSHSEEFAQSIDELKIDKIVLKDFFASRKSGEGDKEKSEEQRQITDRLIAESFKKMSVFTPINFSDIYRNKYSVILNIDLNTISLRDKKEILLKIKETSIAVSRDPNSSTNFYFYPKKLDDQKYKILVLDEFKQNLRIIYKGQNHSKEIQKNLEEKYEFLVKEQNNTFAYKFDTSKQNWSSTELLDFIERAKKGQEPCFYASERPKIMHFSNKLVLDDLPKLLGNEKDHLILFYSQTCPACKRLFEIYEPLCLENLKSKDFPNLEMHRMNGTLNTSYPYAPVLAYFKKGKAVPYLFNNQFLNEKAVRDFITVTYNTDLAENYIQFKHY